MDTLYVKTNIEAAGCSMLHFPYEGLALSLEHAASLEPSITRLPLRKLVMPGRGKVGIPFLWLLVVVVALRRSHHGGGGGRA